MSYGQLWSLLYESPDDENEQQPKLSIGYHKTIDRQTIVCVRSRQLRLYQLFFKMGLSSQKSQDSNGTACWFHRS